MNAIPKKSIEGVEVRGEVIIGFKKALESLYGNPSQYLSKYGILNPEVNKWYPLKALIDMFSEFEKRKLNSILQKIGSITAEEAVWPKDIQTFKDALNSINHAYHINHRRKNKELYDYTNNAIIEGGIGHDILEVNEETKTAIYTCGSFYPCDFDLGMAKAVLRKFKGNITFISIKHDDTKPCRKNGGDTCQYNIKWS